MMPLSLTYHDVNDSYAELQTIKEHYAEWEDTRNGRALVFKAPVIVSHTNPQRRVLFDPKRNANPFFHYMEAIWMLAGSNTAAFPSQFAANLIAYSDDGETFHGAYGHRWRKHFGFDQLATVIRVLQDDPNTRRAVLAMWDPEADLGEDGRDFPCNTHCYFRNMGGELEMTVCNRSNDLVWGMLGANIVHMSILQEYIALSVGLSVGTLHQFTNNLHVYEGWEDKFTRAPDNWYRSNQVRRWQFSPGNFDPYEAAEFVNSDLYAGDNWTCRILRDNAAPMVRSWLAYKSGDLEKAVQEAEYILDSDWRRACVTWLERKVNAQEASR